MLRPVETKCPQCQGRVVLQVSDHHLIVNAAYCSLVLLQHPLHVACDFCKTLLTPAISSIKAWDVAAQRVPPREESQKILVPSVGLS